MEAVQPVGEKINVRQSGIEAVKLFAMFIIVISHVTQTLWHENSVVPSTDYIMDITYATRDIQQFFVSCLSMLGGYGDTIFFACSAWFLVKDKKKLNVKKMFDIMSDVWLINIIILAVFLVGGWFVLPKKLIVDSLFPNIYAWNWYMTVYVLVYAIHTVLNQIIYSLSQKQLLIVDMVLFFLYCFIDYLLGEHFFPNAFTYFIVLYFFIAYIRLYMTEFQKNVKVNVLLLAGGFVMPVLLTAVTNYLGLHIAYFSTNYLRWGGMNSPFVIMAAVSLINLASMKNFTNRAINFLSSCALFVYLIHDNHLIRDYVRPIPWMEYYSRYQHHNAIGFIFIYGIILFVVSLLLSVLYKLFLQKFAHRLGDCAREIAVSFTDRMSDRLMKLK